MSGQGNEIRLARYIALCGAASRREAEKLIEQGQVTVNGHRASHPAQRVTPRDHVKVAGKALRGIPPKVYYILNKPRGTITTRDDPEGRKDVYGLLPHMPFRVEAVGRLDYDTEGALLFTNDGDLANKLLHPSTNVPRRYLAKVYRTPTEKTLARLQRGIRLEDGWTGPAKCRVASRTDRDNAWVEITLTEGRNRLVRRMFDAVGHPVSKLRRESFGTISIRKLPRGAVRVLTHDEVERLRRLASGESNKGSGRVAARSHGRNTRPKKRRGGGPRR